MTLAAIEKRSFADGTLMFVPARRLHLGNFMRRLAMAKAAKPSSLTSLCEKLIRSTRRSSAMTATLHSKWPRSRYRARCSPKSVAHHSAAGAARTGVTGKWTIRQTKTAEVRLDQGRTWVLAPQRDRLSVADRLMCTWCMIVVAKDASKARSWPQNPREAGESRFICRVSTIPRRKK